MEAPDMEAGLAVNRFPARAVAVLATLFAGLAIGGSLGYTIKPQDVVVSHPTATVGHTAPAPISDTCIFVNHHKGC
jgi:hypothetical protein